MHLAFTKHGLRRRITNPSRQTEVLLQQTTQRGIGLGGLKVEVSMGLTTVADLKHKAGGTTATLGAEGERHGCDLGLEVVLLLEVLKRNTANVLSHVKRNYVLPCRALPHN